MGERHQSDFQEFACQGQDSSCGEGFKTMMSLIYGASE
ncbi:hypothetical protein V7x_42190 [Crateriforma conspicua]|uniref:Uncharacterized protein n=1 Tax=Crateriforma conspicua TaxID=2527996 RepID=A0A5C6FMH3_9PLAN|nr:hypothetical protein V7x_42190 [Crateriforma conspicua]